MLACAPDQLTFSEVDVDDKVSYEESTLAGFPVWKHGTRQDFREPIIPLHSRHTARQGFREPIVISLHCIAYCKLQQYSHPMESSSTAAQEEQELKTLRIKCDELGILTAEEEQALDVIASKSISMAIAFLERIEYENSNLIQASMLNTYGKTKEDFKQPAIEINTAVEPRVGGNTCKALIKDSKGETKEVDVKIPTVKIKQDNKEMWVNVNDVTIPVLSCLNGKMMSCIIGAIWNPPSKLKYANEHQVKVYCEDMIRDALKALGLLYEKVDTQMELSMYLMQRDIVILVKNREGRVFFSVQAKSPEVNDKKVFGNEMVAGQMWSYLNAMKAAGNPRPIGAIMTYNKISIVTLGDYTKNEQGEEDGKHKTRIQMAKQCLSTGRSPRREEGLTKEAKEKYESKKESPIKPSEDFHKTNREDNEETMQQQELWEKEVERNLYCSRVHEKGEVFPCLLQAIDIAYRAIYDVDAKQVVCATAKAPIGERLVFKLGEDSIDWVKIGGDVLAEIDDNIPDKATKYLYILGNLGGERITSVYLACSSSGKVCAIKEYRIERSTASNRRDEEENAEKEAKRWTALYGDRFQARAQCLGGKLCLLMPYGHQIAAEPDDRWQHVPDIKKELELFAQCTTGTKGRTGYEYYYMQWRHVLLDTEKNIFLCDLESLEEIGYTNNCDDVVYAQLANLLDPMRNEVKERDTLDWLLGSKTADVVSFICGIDTLKNFFAGSSRDGHTAEVTEHRYGEIIESLFPSAASFEELSANPRAVVTMCMISHYRNGHSVKRHRVYD